MQMTEGKIAVLTHSMSSSKISPELYSRKVGLEEALSTLCQFPVWTSFELVKHKQVCFAHRHFW